MTAVKSWRNFFWLSKTFSGNFLHAVYPLWIQVKFKGNQNSSFWVLDRLEPQVSNNILKIIL